MSLEKEFTNLEQSKYLQEFFEKYPKLKPEVKAYWIESILRTEDKNKAPIILKDKWRLWLNIREDADNAYYFLYGDLGIGKWSNSTGMWDRKIDGKSEYDRFPAHTLWQLEGVLSNDLWINNRKCQIFCQLHFDKDDNRAIYYTYVNNLHYKTFDDYIKRLKADPIHNLIELLKWLDENGHLNKEIEDGKTKNLS